VLTLGANKRKIGRPQFDELAERLELTTRQKDRAYNRLQKNQNTAVDWVEKSFLPDDVKERYLSIMASRYKQLGM